MPRQKSNTSKTPLTIYVKRSTDRMLNIIKTATEHKSPNQSRSAIVDEVVKDKFVQLVKDGVIEDTVPPCWSTFSTLDNMEYTADDFK